MNEMIRTLCGVGIVTLVMAQAGFGQVLVERQGLVTDGDSYEIHQGRIDGPVVTVPAMHSTGDTLLALASDSESSRVLYFDSSNKLNLGWIANDAVSSRWPLADLLSLRQPAAPDDAAALQSVGALQPGWGTLDRLLVTAGLVRYGMNTTQIAATFGEPESRNRFRTAASRFEQMTYRMPGGGQFLLMCENNVLTDHKAIEAAATIGQVSASGVVRIQPELYPYRSTGVSMMVGGGILLIGGGSLLWNRQDIVSSEQKNVTNFSVALISAGVACEVIGIYLYRYTRKVKTALVPTQRGAALQLSWQF
jgi:hypothetical protein